VPRKLNLKTQEIGTLELYLIYQYGDLWEEEWRPLQGETITSLLTVVSQEMMNHALKGLTRPFVKALGIPPEGALRKLPNAACDKRGICPFYHKKECVPLFKKMPSCFEPAGIQDLEARQLGGSLVRMWREGVYLIVVVHPEVLVSP
jgi:hypothetical protein